MSLSVNVGGLPVRPERAGGRRESLDLMRVAASSDHPPQS